MRTMWTDDSKEKQLENSGFYLVTNIIFNDGNRKKKYIYIHIHTHTHTNISQGFIIQYEFFLTFSIMYFMIL